MDQDQSRNDIIEELESESSVYSKHRHSLTNNWIRAACIYLITASVIGVISQLGWLADLCAHFKVQFLIGSAICLALSIWRRMPACIGISFIGVLLNGFFVSPYLITTKPDRAKGQTVIRLVHSNVNSRNPEFNKILEALSKPKPDLIAINELNPKLDKFLREKLIDYPYRISQPRKDNFGIGLFSKVELIDPRIVTTDPDVVPPSIEAAIDFGGERIVIYYTHPFPPIVPQTLKLRDDQLAEVSRRAKEIQGPFILAGDLNTTPWTNGFRQLESEGGLVNPERHFGILATWPCDLIIPQLALDHILTKGNLEVSELSTIDIPGSDHKAITVVIKLLR